MKNRLRITSSEIGNLCTKQFMKLQKTITIAIVIVISMIVKCRGNAEEMLF